MIKIYRKTATIKAEKFDPENGILPQEVFDKEYEHTTSGMIIAMVDELNTGKPSHNWHIKTLEGDLKVKPGDWIATGVNGEHWPIADDVFKQEYAELPVIPKAVADWINKCKNDGISIGDMLCYERQPEKVRDWIELTNGTYEFNQKRYTEYQDVVARAWLDGYVVEV